MAGITATLSRPLLTVNRCGHLSRPLAAAPHGPGTGQRRACDKGRLDCGVECPAGRFLWRSPRRLNDDSVRTGAVACRASSTYMLACEKIHSNLVQQIGLIAGSITYSPRQRSKSPGTLIDEIQSSLVANPRELFGKFAAHAMTIGREFARGCQNANCSAPYALIVANISRWMSGHG